MPLIEWSETTWITQPCDDPSFSEEFEALVRRIDEAGEAVPDVIVDLQNVSNFNSSNITRLLRLRRILQTRDRRMRICAVSNAVWSIMLITRLDKLFDFTEDVTTALTSLQIANAPGD